MAQASKKHVLIIKHLFLEIEKQTIAKRLETVASNLLGIKKQPCKAGWGWVVNSLLGVSLLLVGFGLFGLEWV